MCLRASWLGPVPTTLTTGMTRESIVHDGFSCEQRLGGITPRASAPLLPDSGMPPPPTSLHLMSGRNLTCHPDTRPGQVFQLTVVAPVAPETANLEQSVRKVGEESPPWVSLVRSLEGSGRWVVRARPSGSLACGSLSGPGLSGPLPSRDTGHYSTDPPGGLFVLPGPSSPSGLAHPLLLRACCLHSRWAEEKVPTFHV